MDRQNKTIKVNSHSLSIVRDGLKVFKILSFVFIVAAFLMSGFFAPQTALASGTIREILPSGIAGKIEKNIAGTPAEPIAFLDRELPDKQPPIVIKD